MQPELFRIVNYTNPFNNTENVKYLKSSKQTKSLSRNTAQLTEIQPTDSDSEITDSMTEIIQESNQIADENELNIHNTSTSTGFCVFEYYVIYSDSYLVPRLYFTVTDLEGNNIDSTLILSRLQEEAKYSTVTGIKHLNNDIQPIDSTDHNNNRNNVEYSNNININSWLSEDFLPYLNIPCYSIHPCQTAKFMNFIQHAAVPNIRSDNNNNNNNNNVEFSVISWLSLLAPFVGLNLPMNENITKLLKS